MLANAASCQVGGWYLFWSESLLPFSSVCMVQDLRTGGRRLWNLFLKIDV